MEKDWFTQNLINRNKKGFNNIIVIVGETGIGKSYLGLRLAYKTSNDLNKEFNGENITFTTLQFFNLVKTLPKYSFILFDEIGLQYGHRDFQSDLNKMLTYVLESFRYKLLNVIFTLPHFFMLDYVGRSLAHFLIRVKGRGFGVIYRTHLNQFNGNIYTKRIGKINAELPPKNLIKAYEDKKIKTQEERYSNYINIIKQREKEENKRKETPTEISQRIIENGFVDFINEKGEIDAYLLSAKEEISLTKAYTVRKLLLQNLK